MNTNPQISLLWLMARKLKEDTGDQSKREKLFSQNAKQMAYGNTKTAKVEAEHSLEPRGKRHNSKICRQEMGGGLLVESGLPRSNTTSEEKGGGGVLFFIQRSSQ